MFGRHIFPPKICFSGYLFSALAARLGNCVSFIHQVGRGEKLWWDSQEILGKFLLERLFKLIRPLTFLFVCVIDIKSRFPLFFRLLQTPGERTGERTVTSASPAARTSARSKRLWLACGAESRWRTCTAITTTTTAVGRSRCLGWNNAGAFVGSPQMSDFFFFFSPNGELCQESQIVITRHQSGMKKRLRCPWNGLFLYFALRIKIKPIFHQSFHFLCNPTIHGQDLQSE